MSNRILLEDCVSEFAELNELTDYSCDQVFEYFCAIQLTKDSDTSFTEIENSVVDGSHDGGIDTFIMLVNDRNIYSRDQLIDIKVTENTDINIYIVQSKCAQSFAEKALDKLYISLPVFFELELTEENLLERFNECLVEKIEIFREIWRMSARKKANLEINIAYCCKADTVQMNGAFELKKEQIITLLNDKVAAAKIEFELFSCRELLDLFNKKKSFEIELKFHENPMPISFSQDKYGYIGVAKLGDYLNFITNEEGKIVESIFENNIRHFLGDVDVNKKITKTISDDKENDFWWFNNGITVIASKCSPFQKSLFLEDVQIINGLQTSFSIFQSRNEIKDDDSRSLLIKVILVSDKPIIDKIIYSSNFQNQVPPVLLRATDQIQRDIEGFFLSHGYFYDRRKGYYKNQNKPANRIFTIQDLAQAIEAILFFNSSTARKNPTTIVKSEKSYNKIFSDDAKFKAYLNCVLLVQKAKKFINIKIPQNQKGYVRNFAYHMARITASLVVGNSEYSDEELASVDIDSVNDEFLQSAFSKFSKLLTGYQSTSNENVINIAKSKKFDDFITDEL